MFHWPLLYDSDSDSPEYYGSSDEVFEEDDSDNEDSAVASAISQEKPKEDDLYKDFFQGASQFLSSEAFSDLDVKVGDRIFKCHKVILASWSLYFQALLSSGMKETLDGCVSLEFLEPKDFEDLLYVLYTGKCEVTPENLDSLLCASSYLQVAAVEKKCVTYMLDNATVDNALTFLKYGRQYEIENLVDECRTILRRFFGLYKDSPDILSLSFHDVQYFLMSEELKCSEENLCQFLFSWLKEDKSRRQYAKILIPKVRYLALSDDFMKNTFITQSFMVEDENLKDIRAQCIEYLQAGLEQYRYIGMPEASHRKGVERTDVIALGCIREQDLAIMLVETYTDVKQQLQFKANSGIIRMPSSIKPLASRSGVAMCNYGRMQVFLSTGRDFIRFDGFKRSWERLSDHVLDRVGNCLVLDAERDCIYSVTASERGISVERYRVNDESASRKKWVVLTFGVLAQSQSKDINNDISDNQDLIEIGSLRTCAFMAGRDIFCLHETETGNVQSMNIFSINAVSGSVCRITGLPFPVSPRVAVHHKDLVFLIDKYCHHIMRMSNDTYTVDMYGEVGHDLLDYTIKRNFGACLWGRFLVMIDSHPEVLRKLKAVTYDLDSHRTHEFELLAGYWFEWMPYLNLVKMTVTAEGHFLNIPI